MRAYARNVAAIGCFARRRLNPDWHYDLLFPLESVQQFDRLTRILGAWVSRSDELMHVRVINTYIWSDDWLGGQISQYLQLFLHPMTILAANVCLVGRKRRRHAHASKYSTRKSPRLGERGYWFHPPPSRTILTVTALHGSFCASQGDPHNSRNRLCSRQLLKAPPHAGNLSSAQCRGSLWCSIRLD
jgi:hypothetical protein